MNDLISRRDAIDSVEKVDWYHINRNGELVKGANSKDHEPLYKAKDIHDALENVKPVQPKHGKWHTTNDSYVVLDVCDQCMRSVRHVAPFYDYCPHCGADMRGEAE